MVNWEASHREQKIDVEIYLLLFSRKFFNNLAKKAKYTEEFFK